MNGQPPNRPEDAPGHYGAGYGEQVPEDAPPRPAPATDDEKPTRDLTPSGTSGTPSGASGTSGPSDPSRTSPGDGGEPVVFTPEDVGARPPDHTPTENAPASEKAGLIFERS